MIELLENVAVFAIGMVVLAMLTVSGPTLLLALLVTRYVSGPDPAEAVRDAKQRRRERIFEDMQEAKRNGQAYDLPADWAD